MAGCVCTVQRAASIVAFMGTLSDGGRLFINHDRITRTVTNLPNGIRTVTESSDPRIAQLLKDHVTRMRQRVETENDPGLPIESQAAFDLSELRQDPHDA